MYRIMAERDDFLLSGSLVLRREVFQLGGLYVSFYLIWGKCRCREILLSIEIQYGKEGLPQIWNKCGWNNKSRSINWLSDILSHILNETIKAVLKLIAWNFIAYSQWNNKDSSKADCLILYRLFIVFLRPSFGACAPPSPNLAHNLNILRWVGRLSNLKISKSL